MPVRVRCLNRRTGHETGLARRLATIWIVVLVLVGGPAASQTAAENWYVELFGGATFPRADAFRINRVSCEGDCDVGANASFETGTVVGLAVGRKVAARTGVELEFTHRSADGDTEPQDRFRSWLRQSGTARSTAVVLSAQYDFPPFGREDRWQLYGGGGLGMARLSAEQDDASDPFKPRVRSGYAPALQGVAGVRYALSSRFGLFTELRWFGVVSEEWSDDLFSFDTASSTMDVLVGLRFGCPCD